MEKNKYSFDMDKWSREKKKKARKPKKEKKQKGNSLDIGASGSFQVEKFEKKPKKEKSPKPVKEKNTKIIKNSINDKESKLNKFSPKIKRKEKTDEFSSLDEKQTKPSRLGEVFKKLTKNKPVFIIVCTFLVLVLLVGGLFLLNIIRYNRQIKYIAIDNMPDKVIYYVGDETDFTGLKLVAVLNNGKTKDVNISECTFTGFDTSKSAEYQKITVRYLDCFVSFNIIIKEKIKPISKLSYIEMDTLPKTEYKLGDRLDTNGGVICCHYNDGSTFLVSLVNSYVSGYRTIDAPGVYELTVIYEKDGVEAITTYTITVTE